MTPGQSIRVLVCGGRDYADKARVFKVLSSLDAKYPITSVVHGAARGADTLAALWARSKGCEELAFPADWDAHGKRAGILRNVTMLKASSPDCVVAFPGGRGTAHMVSIAQRAGVHVWQIV